MLLETYKLSINDLKLTCSTTIYKNLSLTIRICSFNHNKRKPSIHYSSFNRILWWSINTKIAIHWYNWFLVWFGTKQVST